MRSLQTWSLFRRVLLCAGESSKKIAIQLPSNANIALQMANFQNIEVQVRFCPSDAAVRERWLVYSAAYHKWIADTAAWSQVKRRGPNAVGLEPVPPRPPSGGNPDFSCEL